MCIDSHCWVGALEGFGLFCSRRPTLISGQACQTRGLEVDNGRSTDALRDGPRSIPSFFSSCDQAAHKHARPAIMKLLKGPVHRQSAHHRINQSINQPIRVYLSKQVALHPLLTPGSAEPAGAL